MYKILFILTLLSNALFSQTNSTIEKTGGFIILESKTELSTSDIQKIESASFDEYRFYSIRKKVQLVRGPLIELKSIKELEAEGKVFSTETLQLAKSKSESFKHESIGNVDLGLGVSYLKTPE